MNNITTSTEQTLDAMITKWKDSVVMQPSSQASVPVCQETGTLEDIESILSCYTQKERTFLELFSPSKQSLYCAPKNLKRCYTGTAPTLIEVSEKYGLHIALTWVIIQIRDLANFTNVKKKLDAAQYNDMRDIICLTYGYMKLTELMHFFWLFKQGEFGYFYGAVDPLVILKALRDFQCAVWYKKKTAYEKEVEKERNAVKEAAEAQGKAMFDSWLKNNNIEYFDEEILNRYFLWKETQNF